MQTKRKITPMTYTKPEISSLGDAVRIIQSLGKIGQSIDPLFPSADPAYDLDD
jgi:hypothetical protein